MEKVTTVECQPTEFYPGIHSLVSGHLQSGEAILFSCQTAHQDSPFISETNVYGQIITERRVIQAIRNKFLNIEIAPSDFISNLGARDGIRNMMKRYGNGNLAGSILLGDIAGLETSNYRLGCYGLKISGMGGTDLKLVFASNEVFQKFLAVLQKAREDAKVNTSHDRANIGKRLEELTQLYKDGLITEVEYQSKRKEILNQF